MKYYFMKQIYKYQKASFLFLLFVSLSHMATSVNAQELRVTHEFNKDNPPGNIAVSKDGRIFMSNHFFYGAEFKIVEVLKDGETKAYPDLEFSRTLNPVLGLIVDKNNILWMLETASGKDKAGRLIGWNIDSNKLHKMIYLALPNIPESSFLNDLAVDTKHQAVYITDTAQADNSGLLVVDLKTGHVRRVLNGSKFTRPEEIDMVIDDQIVTLGDEGARIGANPITIDSKYEWVYFAPMTGTKLYRLKTTDLLDQSLNESELRARVQLYSEKPISDGIAIDDADNIYISDITKNAIGVINAERKYTILYKDQNKLSWVDGFATGADQRIYATVNQLHKSPVLNRGKDASTGRYYIVDFDALAQTSAGR